MHELKRVDLSGRQGIYYTDLRVLKKINGKLFLIHKTELEKNEVANVMAMEINPETLEVGSLKIISPIATTDSKLKFGVPYYDNPANLKKDLSEGASGSGNYSNLVLVAAIVSPDGSVKRTVAVDLQQESFLVLTEVMKDISKDSLMVPMQKIRGFGGIGNGLRWATISIK